MRTDPRDAGARYCGVAVWVASRRAPFARKDKTREGLEAF